MFRILKYPWHTGHDYELSKLNAEYFLLCGTHRKWNVAQRPIPTNVHPIADPDSVKTDLMILHVDQWTWTELDKRYLFSFYRDHYPGPKVVINHGTNMVDGCSSETMRVLTAGLPVVCSSPTALRLWDLPNSVHIRHGMSPEEWPPTNYGRNNIVVTQPKVGFHDECRNGHAVLGFESRYAIAVEWIGRDRNFDNFHRYVSFLGSSSVFFNPSFASSNPRARSEAMLCGLAVVTTKSHDEGEYIVNGENGFASNDMEELWDFLKFLHRNPAEARRIGRNGRKTAQEVFHISRFRDRWHLLIQAVLGGKDVASLQKAFSAT